jgi:hypothetical protein
VFIFREYLIMNIGFKRHFSSSANMVALVVSYKVVPVPEHHPMRESSAHSKLVVTLILLPLCFRILVREDAERVQRALTVSGGEEKNP